jgi:hypothetical protein
MESLKHKLCSEAPRRSNFCKNFEYLVFVSEGPHVVRDNPSKGLSNL